LVKLRKEGALLSKRMIVKIDEKLCNGCGACISPCAEGALELVNGKAKVIREELCDGAGFCLGICPTGALSLEAREAVDFSEKAVMEQRTKNTAKYIPQVCSSCGKSEDQNYLIAVKYQGNSTWICTRCLPRLIHG
jgi:Na+-translocating ferredoxin:NAD+ oxidoreductase RNF subunit RnfB